MIIGGNSRRNIGAKPVVVFITDGDWNTGGDPQPIVNQLKDDPLNVRLWISLLTHHTLPNICTDFQII